MTETEKFSLAGEKKSFYMQLAIPKLFLSLGSSGGILVIMLSFQDFVGVVKICVLFLLQLLGIK